MKYLVISDIHGNCDTLKKALAYKEQLGAEHILLLGDLLDQMVLEFPIRADFQTLQLGTGRRVIMTHGHLNEYQMGLCPECVVLSGHTHVATAEQDAEGIYRCNPGSVSMPKGTLPASFGLLDEQGFGVYSLDGERMLYVEF